MSNKGKITREAAEAMNDRQLLAAYVAKRSPAAAEYRAQALIMRNGRWGTCGGCPGGAQGVRLEQCSFTERYDHNIDSTKDGKFYAYDREVPRSVLIDTLIA